ncbi:unnamed protein product [Brassica rapa]|uniref:Uncharacterized protein n=1 Tax=Brassica campestris TaxID=3711 RepID=A0A8D9CVR5_BRACM|nr:unnamed protein product [Brassica rapa]
MCVLADTHRRPVTNVLICVLMDSHGLPVCGDGHTWTHTDSHGRPCPRTSCVCWRTPTDVLCVLNRQPTWAKITQTVHGKGQRAESNDQRADMCTDGKPRTSCNVLCVLTDTHGRPVCADGHPQTPRGPKSPKQSTGRVSMLSPRTNVLICVLIDSHGRPVCADGHTRTNTDSPGRPPRTSCVCWQTPTDVLCVLNTQPTWAKITQTVHGKGQRAESKDQRADMCTDGQPRTSYVLCVLMDTHGHTWTATDILCVLTDTHRRHVCADRHPRTSCVQPTWAKITRTVHGKGQRAESKDQRADMCTDGQPQNTDVLCVLTDSHRHPVCAGGHPRTSCVY